MTKLINTFFLNAVRLYKLLFLKKDFKKFTVFQPKHKLKIQVNFFVDTRDAHLTYIVISYNFSLKSEISSMNHTKALY